MKHEKITVSAEVNAPKSKVWDCYTQPEHITQWNFADANWHCPSATNELKIGGLYNARMEAKDGSFGFDFAAVYSELNIGESFVYGFGDRSASVTFEENQGVTTVTVSFDAENENPIELQRQGWQSILNNFKNYTEKQ